MSCQLARLVVMVWAGIPCERDYYDDADVLAEEEEMGERLCVASRDKR